MPKLNGLSPKQRKFVAAYIKCDNGTQAAQLAYPNQTYGAQRVTACENLANPNIKYIISNHMLKNEITTDRVLNKLSDKMESDDEAISLKATELAGKHLRMFREQVDHTVVLDRVKAIGWSSGKEAPAKGLPASDEVIEVIPTKVE